MLIVDPIGDFLTRIRNAQLRQRDKLTVPASKMLVSIAEILKQEGFIADYQLLETKPQKTLELELCYTDGCARINNLRRVSKPGVRKYIGYRDIPKVRQGLGVAIVSTPKGVMSGVRAKAEKVGGELLCIVY